MQRAIRFALGKHSTPLFTAFSQQQQGFATGTVKWFNMAKGFGFIIEDGGDHDGREVFVHQTSINCDGFRYLKDGEAVDFEVHESEKGPQAVNVTGPNGSALDRVNDDDHYSS